MDQAYNRPRNNPRSVRAGITVVYDLTDPVARYALLLALRAWAKGSLRVEVLDRDRVAVTFLPGVPRESVR